MQKTNVTSICKLYFKTEHNIIHRKDPYVEFKLWLSINNDKAVTVWASL